MRNNKELSLSINPFEKKPVLPIKPPSEKLKDDNSKKYFLKCISSHPLAQNTSKEQLRITYLDNLLQGKTHDPKFNHLLGLPKTFVGSNTFSQGAARTQLSLSPFNRSLQAIPGSYTPQPSNFSLSFSTETNKNSFLINPNINCSLGIQNQMNTEFHIYNNNLQRQNNFVRMDNFAKQNLPNNTNFETGFFETKPEVGIGFPLIINNSTESSGFGFNSNPSGLSIFTSNQLTKTPSFGNLINDNQQSTGFNQFTPLSNFQSQKFPHNPQVSDANLFSTNNTSTSNYENPIIGQTQRVNQNKITGQLVQSFSYMHQNIKQLLHSKPNLWNTLCLDPQYRYGYNQEGRIYIKSVLQRIIDEQILRQQSLSKIIIQIYKKIYGPQNLQKFIQTRKQQLGLNDKEKIKDYKLQDLLAVCLNKNKNIESAFPQNFDKIDDSFYRSKKRNFVNLIRDDSPILQKFKRDKTQSRPYGFQPKKKYFEIKRLSQPLELKIKFQTVKRREIQKCEENPYTVQGLDRITKNILELRTDYRRQIMAKPKQLPDVEGFVINPSLDFLKKLTRYEIQSVPHVTISNEWGSIRFKSAISLLSKKLSQCLAINKKSVEINDDQWKCKDAQIKFTKFADFSELNQSEKNALEQKIKSWCKKQKLKLIQINQEIGEVTIQI